MKTEKQLAQLAALHAATRGRRIHPEEPELIEALRAGISAGRWSRRALARRVGASDTSVARWLRGIDRPSPARAARLKGVLA